MSIANVSNRMKMVVGVGVAALLGTYLLGFVPQYRRKRSDRIGVAR